MTKAQVAQRLGVTTRSVERYAHVGELKPLDLPQRGLVFRRTDVEAFAARWTFKRGPQKKSSQ